ncbi:MAG: RecX family transcriptional regulator [Actinobacteria bacterium]|nr:RecX family transcriptional regulator [Actinomycetota bacterium]
MAERSDALETALRALRARDRSTAELAARLERRGVGEDERADVLELLDNVGYIDDRRFARHRAVGLAERGAGDALIRDDLERRGVAGELVAEAIEALEPETQRAARIVELRGRSAKTARYLAARGFDEDALAGLVAEEE